MATHLSWGRIFRIKRVAGGVMMALFLMAGMVESAFGLDENMSGSLKKWETMGRLAAEEAVGLIRKASGIPQKKNLILLTNAGYAEVGGGVHPWNA